MCKCVPIYYIRIGVAFLGNNSLIDKQDNIHRTYCGIDLFKFIAAILVVFIHANAAKLEIIPNIVLNCFSGMAVPFFFIVSGFFFQKGLSKAANKKSFLFNYEKKLLLLYLFWQVINLPSNIFMYIGKYPDASTFRYILYLFRSIFLCGNGVVWYILAMAEAAFVIYLLHKFSVQRCLYVFIFVGLLLMIGYDSFSGILSDTIYSYVNKVFYIVFSWSNNFIMKAVPFMGIGYLISANNRQISFKISSSIFILLSFFSLFVYLFNINSIVNFNVNIILNIPLSIFFFLMSVSIKLNLKENVSVTLRELSSSIYFLHTYFIYYFMDVVFGVNFSSMIKVFVALIGSIIVYIIVEFINIKIFKFALNIGR